MNPDGQSTSNVANNIKRKLNEEGYDVYSDHGEAGEFIGTIAVSYEEKTEGKLGREEEISQLDIAVVEEKPTMEGNLRKAIALIEIEETTDNPKKLIGDIFTVFMGKSIFLPGKKREKVDVNSWTTLIIIGKEPSRKDQLVAHKDRNIYIQDKAKNAMSALETANAKIGNIIVESISINGGLDEKLDAILEEKLMEKIHEAIRRYISIKNMQQ